MSDPLERRRDHGEKPDYAGLLTFWGVPYTHDPAELAGVDGFAALRVADFGDAAVLPADAARTHTAIDRACARCHGPLG